uniref:Uncharacterized protein n=1 Tax=Salix viminalis TaxID=40686 RepID=A0A6N2NB87_SALVM
MGTMNLAERVILVAEGGETRRRARGLDAVEASERVRCRGGGEARERRSRSVLRLEGTIGTAIRDIHSEELKIRCMLLYRLETQESAIAKPCLYVLLPSVLPIFTKELFYSLMPPRPPATSFVATAVVDGLPPVTTSDHD